MTSNIGTTSFSAFSTNNDVNSRRLTPNVTFQTQKPIHKTQQENSCNTLVGTLENKASSKMPILDDTSDTDGNWVRGILLEKERRINNGCDLHDKCIPTQKLKGMLECPACHSIPKPKSVVHQCNNGHILCQKCRIPSLITCPLCGAPLNVSSSNRNLLCEKIITLLPLECSFLEHGCKASEIRNTEELLVHEKNCPHRLVRCVHPFCQFLMPVNKLTKHILEVSHPFNVVMPPTGINTLEAKIALTRIASLGNSLDSRSCWSVAHIMIDGRFSLGRKHFFTELIQGGPESDWGFWVYMLGSEQEAVEYEFTLTLNPGTLQSSHQYHGCCVSVDKDIESILLKDGSKEGGVNTSSKYLKLSNRVLLNSVVNGILNMSVEIKKTSHKFPLAVSVIDAINWNPSFSKHLDCFQTEYASRMLQNVSSSYKQIEKISSISGQATAFEKGPYSRSNKIQIMRRKEKAQVITIS